MLGDNIRKYRRLNNMSQDELAEKLNVTRQSISLWENEQTQPSLENIVALAKLFEVSTDELLASDKTELSASNTATAPRASAPKKKTKNLVLILGAVTVVAVLSTAVYVLLGTNNDSKSNDGKNDHQTTETMTEGDPQVTTPAESDSPGTDTVEDQKDIFGHLKEFVIENGTINGDYCYYSKSADCYGGYAEESFSLYYWGDTNEIEFCLHSVIDDTFSVNFYLYVPEDHSGEYEYVSSYYYRDTGSPLYEARGTINAKEFTDNYPLNCTKYFGSTEDQNTFMEMSRQGVCDLIACIERFIEVENIKYSFKDFGFLKFAIDRS